MKSSTETLIKALQILAQEIESPDGVANQAIAEAAERLQELSNDVLAKRVAELSAERDALAVKVEQLRIAYCDYCATGFDDALDQAFEATPAQCLAEVKAQAGRDGYQACVDALGEAAQNAMDNGDTSLIGCIGEIESYTTILDAEQYANQIRQQAKGK